VIVPTEYGLSVARLHLVFTCEALDRSWAVALVTWFETVSEADKTRIGMRRMQEQTHGSFISVDTILRLAFTEQAGGNARQFWLSDLYDADMYLRLNKL
jgi:hypothetical protein